MAKNSLELKPVPMDFVKELAELLESEYSDAMHFATREPDEVIENITKQIALLLTDRLSPTNFVNFRSLCGRLDRYFPE